MGEMLYAISKKYGVSIEALKTANKLSTDQISRGQELIVPESEQNYLLYEVKSGDTLFGISKKFGKKVEEDLKAIAQKFVDTSFENITKVFIENSDGVSISAETLDAPLQDIYDAYSGHKLDYTVEENQSKAFSAFFDKVIDEPVLA